MIEKSFIKAKITQSDIDDDLQASLKSNLDRYFEHDAIDTGDYID